jgi:hypothetical protein
MEPGSDLKLFQMLDSAIDSALRSTTFGGFDADFVITAGELDPRLDCAKLISHAGTRALWEYADEYFDSWAHGFPYVQKMDWQEARQRLEAMRFELRKELLANRTL